MVHKAEVLTLDGKRGADAHRGPGQHKREEESPAHVSGGLEGRIVQASGEQLIRGADSLGRAQSQASGLLAPRGTQDGRSSGALGGRETWPGNYLKTRRLEISQVSRQA